MIVSSINILQMVLVKVKTIVIIMTKVMVIVIFFKPNVYFACIICPFLFNF